MIQARYAPNRGLWVLACLTLQLALTAGCTVDSSLQLERLTVRNPAAGLWAGEPRDLMLVLEQSFGAETEPDSHLLGRAQTLFVDVDNAGNVYVLDSQNNRVVSFDSDGNVRWIGGRQGAGPGELDGARGLLVHEVSSAVLVLNQRGTRLDAWSLDGEFRGSLRNLKERPRVLADTGNGTIILGTVAPGFIGATVWTLPDENAARSRLFEIREVPETNSPPTMIDIAAYSDVIVSGSSSRYEMRFHNEAGELIRIVTRDVDYPSRPRYFADGPIRGRIDLGKVRAPMKLGGGYWLAHVSWVRDADAAGKVDPTVFPESWEWESSLDLFDSEGRFLQSYIPEGGVDIAQTRYDRFAYPTSIGIPVRTAMSRHPVPSSTPESTDPASLANVQLGYLYTLVEEPFPQIRRFRIELASR